jgi:hypothetical protein
MEEKARRVKKKQRVKILVAVERHTCGAFYSARTNLLGRFGARNSAKTRAAKSSVLTFLAHPLEKHGKHRALNRQFL